MNCEGFQTVAIELARRQILDANERARALAHTDKCDRCRRLFTYQNKLSEGLRAMTMEMKSIQAPVGLEERVRAALHDQNLAPSRQTIRLRERYLALAVAAVLLTAFGLFAWGWRAASVRPQPALANANTATAPAPEQKDREQSLAFAVTGNQASMRLSASTTESSGSRQHPARSQLAKRGIVKLSTVEPDAVAVTNAQANEVATEFLAVGYGSALDLQDGGQLVRVELPRSALARFGLPMNMERADERIKADVLVGTDGLARAIRFVELKAINKY